MFYNDDFRKLRLLYLAALLAFAAGLSSASAQTVVAHRALNQPMPYVAGMHQLTVGPVAVADFSQVRIYAWGGGSGTIDVTVSNVNASGEFLGLLDRFTIDPASYATTYITKLYEVPGKYLQLYFSSLNNNAANVTIYGRR